MLCVRRTPSGPGRRASLVDFMTSIRTVLSKYVDFTGRARRSEYWWFFLASGVLNIILRTASPILGLLVGLALFLPGLAVGIRRMHDTGHSGWFILIPIYNIVLLATDSAPGDNQYGPNPKGMGGQAPMGYGPPPPGYGPPPTQ